MNAIIRWLERNKHCGDSWEDEVVQNADPVVLNITANFKYDERFPEDAEFRAAAGETDLQIAGRLGISQASFYNYKKQFPEFAAALERGRKECYIRLRRQLLALALGQCTVVTQTYRDGDFRKCTERQLPPNLRAIRYWLDNMSAQRDSIPSESGRAGKGDGKNGSNENNGDKAEKTDDTPARRPSISSECGRAGKGDGKNGSNEKNGDKTEKTDDMTAQRLSIPSESDGCPAGNAGRMGETASAQRPSNSSESGKGAGKNGNNENNGGKAEKTENTPAQRPSIPSESAVSPLRPLCLFRP